MIVRKVDEVEAMDVGEVLGTDKLGIRIQWLNHNDVGDSSYVHNFAMRRFTFDPGVSYPLHHHKYVEAVHIISGRGYFENEEGRVEVGPGDVVYTASEEPHGIGNLGDEPFVMVCAIDCIDGGGNCSPKSKAVKLNK